MRPFSLRKIWGDESPFLAKKGDFLGIPQFLNLFFGRLRSCKE
jgi:hypothetical protein